jgi:hypothetical protein
VLAPLLRSLTKIFPRHLTYVTYFRRDLRSPELIHLFGANRCMPEDGDSFDIWRHLVIDIHSFEVTPGLEQRGNDFSIKSAFAKRALEAMSQQMNKPLDAPTDDIEEDDSFRVLERDSNDSDTEELEAPPSNGLILTKRTIGERERYQVELRRDGETLSSHILTGDCTYFRHLVFVPEENRLFATYRRTHWLGNGGSGFYVLDLQTGALVHDGYVI